MESDQPSNKIQPGVQSRNRFGRKTKDAKAGLVKSHSNLMSADKQSEHDVLQQDQNLVNVKPSAAFNIKHPKKGKRHHSKKSNESQEENDPIEM